MIIEVVVTLPDGHTWHGEFGIDDADLDVGEPGEMEIDLDDDETRSYIFERIAEWLIQDQLSWAWAVKTIVE